MRLRLTLVGCFFALMLIYIGANSYFSISYVQTASDVGWQLGLDGRVQVYGEISRADISLLRNGDEIVALDGQEFRNSRQLFRTFGRIPPGDFYTIVVRRDGETKEFTLRTAPYSTWTRLNTVLFVLFLPAVFLLIGLAVFLLKPDDKQALLLALMMGMYGAAWPSFSFMIGDLSGWLRGLFLLAQLIGGFCFAVFLHFFLVFPEKSPLLRRFPRFEYYLYLPLLLAGYPFVAISAYRSATEPERFYEVFQEFFPLLILSLTVNALYLLGGLLALAVSYRRASQLLRRKMHIVLVGVTAGFLPFLLSNVVFFITEPSSFTLPWMISLFIAELAMVLVPLSFAYAIVRHQVIPVSLIIRRSVQYLLAKNALRVLLALPTVGLVLSIIANRHRTVADILLRSSFNFFALFIIADIAAFAFRKRLSVWVDRKFFREQYNQDQILRELIEDVKQTDSMAEMSKLVSRKVDAALHPERMYLFYREEERRDLSLGYSSGGSTESLSIPEEFEMLRFMEYQGGAQDFPFPQKIKLPESEKAWLAQLDTRLIVPLTGTDNRLAGLFLLGQKKSEVPYTAGDRQLLETLAAQIAIVYENARLKERVDKDRRIKHEVLARVAERSINLLKECPRCGACYDSAAQFCANDDSELTLTLPVERIIEGRYRLDKLIGRGGMGAVYQAFDLRLNRKVAVKILGGQLFGNSEALRRFEREAQTSARLSHPHIISVYDYGALSTEGAYLVMELVEGETLNSLLKREKYISPTLAAEWFEQILAAIGAAHSGGVVHRDLKPDNIFIVRAEAGDANIKVLDFGLAKFTQSAAAESPSSMTAAGPVTTPGAVMGTLGYMAPEQLTGGVVDERSDLFSMGVMIVEAITGRRPFDGKTYHELLTAILQHPFHLPAGAPAVQQLDDVLQKCLAKDRQKRFASAAKLRQELIPALRACPPLYTATPASLEADTFILKT